MCWSTARSAVGLAPSVRRPSGRRGPPQNSSNVVPPQRVLCGSAPSAIQAPGSSTAATARRTLQPAHYNHSGCLSYQTSRSTSRRSRPASPGSRSSGCASATRFSCARSRTGARPSFRGARCLGVRRMGKRIVFELDGRPLPRPAPDDRRAAALERAGAPRSPARSAWRRSTFPAGTLHLHRGRVEAAGVDPHRARRGGACRARSAAASRC